MSILFLPRQEDREQKEGKAKLAKDNQKERNGKVNPTRNPHNSILHIMLN